MLLILIGSYWSVEFKILHRGSSRKGGHPRKGVESKLQAKVDLHQSDLKKGKSSASMDQRIGDNFRGVNSSHHQRPYDNMSTQVYHDVSAYNPYPFHEGRFQGRPQARGRRRRGQGGRGYYRPHEKVPRQEAWHENNLYEDYGDNSNVQLNEMFLQAPPFFFFDDDQ
ncbi:hypothetical protein M9H77_30080 [Catharanthus roseus]|uniref:Uncharacterized protein n=1 Tax=Catharanthus roseus TaxID=4058 RepID=A0ACB9ZYG5_CATRO|nr:hypothetical protein M9H77_30080 [Catharanthus roseus]